LRGNYLARMGRYAEAEKYQTKAWEMNKMDPHWLVDRMLVRQKLGIWQGTIDDATYIKTHLTHKQQKVTLARVDAYIHLQQYDKAVADLKEQVKEFPADRQSHDLLRQVYLKLGKTDLANQEQRFLEKLDEDIRPIN